MFKTKVIYPKSWNEEDISKYKYYFNEGKKMYNMPDDMISLCCVRQINEEKGLVAPIDYSTIRDIPREELPPQFEEFSSEILVD